MLIQVRSLTLLIGGLVILLGCSKQGMKTEDYTPPTDKARWALETALNHLQSGKSPGRVPGTSPSVDFLDSKWKTGQELKSYEILSDEPGTNAHLFKVRLTLAKGSPQEVRYAVFGIDPLQVYREEDYQSLTGAGK